MRTPFPKHYLNQTFRIDQVPLQLHCRHELIPILAALQRIYSEPNTLQPLFQLIAADVNPHTSSQRGRTGLSYWEILVLMAVRLGCNLDYDALQDLADNHTTLRRILGIHDEPSPVDGSCPYAWHRIRDNLCLLRPSTMEAINHLLVDLGHQLEPTAPEQVRGDTFVVETNIHYPTESSLLGDGARKLLEIATRVQSLVKLRWRPAYWQRKLKKALRVVNQACASKKANAKQQQRRAYRRLYQVVDAILEKAMALEEPLRGGPNPTEPVSLLRSAGALKELQHYLSMTVLVRDYSEQRVLHGQKIEHAAKLFSLFEPHTELIHRGKKPVPIQYGHKVLVIEDAVGFICHYKVLSNGSLEKEIVVDEMKVAQNRLHNKIRVASFDKGFHSPPTQADLAQVIPEPCLPKPGSKQGAAQEQQASEAYQAARRRHPGVEALIGSTQRGNGMKRCRDRGTYGYERHVGLGILGRNLHTLGKLLLRRKAQRCLAGATQRKKAS